MFINFCLLLILVIFISLICSYYNKIEQFTSEKNIYYYRENNKKANNILEDIFKEYNIKRNNKETSKIIIPNNYFKNINSEFKNIKSLNNKIFLIIPGIQQIDEKNKLWNNLTNVYGIKKSSTIIPKSYNLRNNNELNNFMLNHNGTFIVKTEIEDAKGLIVSKDKTKIIELMKDKKYTLVQKCIMNQLLIKNRCFKLRMFILIHCHNNVKTIYLHKKGFLYYAKEKFNKDYPNFDNIIANAWWFKNKSKKEIIDFLIR